MISKACGNPVIVNLKTKCDINSKQKYLNFQSLHQKLAKTLTEILCAILLSVKL